MIYVHNKICPAYGVPGWETVERCGTCDYIKRTENTPKHVTEEPTISDLMLELRGLRKAIDDLLELTVWSVMSSRSTTRRSTSIPTCDTCGMREEDVRGWCGTCGSCSQHCEQYIDCPEPEVARGNTA